MASGYFHSVTLDKDQCIGCTDCIKRCPTEAIRVRNGKARITNERCIDCGLCITVCRHHAKKATSDSLKVIDRYQYKVAIPSTSLYAQFRDVSDVNKILAGLKSLGFDEVFDMSKAAEAVNEGLKTYLQRDGIRKPVISSACPAVTRLISIRFPSLLENVAPVVLPMDAAAMAAEVYLAQKGIPRENIGLFFIAPCAAKVTHARTYRTEGVSLFDGVISIQDVFIKMKRNMKGMGEKQFQPLYQGSRNGISLAAIGGERQVMGIENSISVDSIENVIKVLEMVENGRLDDVDFIEAMCCTGGCIGGTLTVQNSFIAESYIGKVLHTVRGYSEQEKLNLDKFYEQMELYLKEPRTSRHVLNLDEDLAVAIQKMNDITDLYKKMPKIDCGSCGAPTCLAHAEDIVQGKAAIEDCIFMLRAKVKELAQDVETLSEKIPENESGTLGKENKNECTRTE